MASLRSMILDPRRRIESTCGIDDQIKLQKYFNATQKALQSRDTILVNNLSVLLDVASHPFSKKFHEIPLPKPPYPVMWLECFFQNSVHIGCLVTRTEVTGEAHLRKHIGQSLIEYHLGEPRVAALLEECRRSTLIEVFIWRCLHTEIELVGDFFYWLNAEGEWQEGLYGHPTKLPDEFEPTKENLQRAENEEIAGNLRRICLAEYDVLHTFSRLNCHNVKLVPSGSSVAKQNGKKPPSSVWHEIVVTSIEKLRREQKSNVAPEGEKRVLRFHNIRGHYADYRKGNGLFGNPKLKKLFWVPEHTAGDPELGTVVSSYKVK